MTAKFLSVMTIFIASLLIGFNCTQITETVQAMPIPTPVELPMLNAFSIPAHSVKNESATVDVNVNLESNEVSVKGTADANVIVTQKEKIVPKYITKVKRDTVKVLSHPIVRMTVPEPTPLLKALGYE